MNKFRQLSRGRRRAWILSTLALTLCMMIYTSMSAVMRTTSEDGLGQLVGCLTLLVGFLMSPFMIRKIKHGVDYLVNTIDKKLVKV